MEETQLALSTCSSILSSVPLANSEDSHRQCVNCSGNPNRKKRNCLGYTYIYIHIHPSNRFSSHNNDSFFLDSEPLKSRSGLLIYSCLLSFFAYEHTRLRRLHSHLLASALSWPPVLLFLNAPSGSAASTSISKIGNEPQNRALVRVRRQDSAF